MPRVIFKPRITMKIPGEGKPFRRTYIAYYKAFSTWSERIYPTVIARTPRYKGNDPRRTPGFVASHIKVMWTTGPGGIRYKAIGVPGGSVKGTPAYHALMAIYSLHEGWRSPFIRRPVSKRIMTFPLRRGETFRNPRAAAHAPGVRRGPKRWVITKKAYQTGGPKRNRWLANTLQENVPLLLQLWNDEINKLGRRRKRVELS